MVVVIGGNVFMLDEASIELAQTSGRGRIVGLGIVILVVALVGLIGVIGYFGIGPMLIQPTSPRPADNSPDVANVLGASVTPAAELTPTPEAGMVPVQLPRDQMQALIDNLGQKVMVPREVPQVSIIEDPKAIADQTFFASAEANDLLVVFQTTKIVYIFRPSTNTVVAQGTIK